MKYFVAIVMIAMLMLTACAPARQKLSPQANVTLKDANVFYQQKNVEKALEAYLKVLKDNPDYAIALRRVADINLYFGEQDQTKAIDYNKKAFEYYARAIAVTEAFDKLKEQDQIDIRDMKRRQRGAWTRIFTASDQLLSQGNTNDALAGFLIANQLDPERPEPLIKLKDLYEKELNQPEQAEKIMLQLYAKKPNEVALLQEIGAFYFNKPDFAKALEFFQKAAVEAPTDTNIQMNISFCYYEMKDYANALVSTEKVLLLEPTNLDALNNARAISLRLENDDKAISYTMSILELKDDDKDYNTLCRLLSMKQRNVELIQWAEKWFKYDPTSIMAAQYVALGANRTGNKALESKYNDIIRRLQ